MAKDIRPNPKFPLALMKRLKQIAKRERHTISDQINIAVEDHVRAKELDLRLDTFPKG